MTEYSIRRFDPGTPLAAARTDSVGVTPARAELVAALARQDPSFSPEGATDAYLQGRLDAINGSHLSLSRELEAAAGQANRDAWRQPSPFATKPESAPRAAREDADATFSADDARQASHDAARNAWRQ